MHQLLLPRRKAGEGSGKEWLLGEGLAEEIGGEDDRLDEALRENLGTPHLVDVKNLAVHWVLGGLRYDAENLTDFAGEAVDVIEVELFHDVSLWLVNGNLTGNKPPNLFVLSI
jgi:hypothetical protein